MKTFWSIMAIVVVLVSWPIFRHFIASSDPDANWLVLLAMVGMIAAMIGFFLKGIPKIIAHSVGASLLLLFGNVLGVVWFLNVTVVLGVVTGSVIFAIKSNGTARERTLGGLSWAATGSAIAAIIMPFLILW